MIFQIRYKITLLLCKVFGHRYKDDSWVFREETYDTCTRCRRIINISFVAKKEAKEQAEAALEKIKQVLVEVHDA